MDLLIPMQMAQDHRADSTRVNITLSQLLLDGSRNSKRCKYFCSRLYTRWLPLEGLKNAQIKYDELFGLRMPEKEDDGRAVVYYFSFWYVGDEEMGWEG